MNEATDRARRSIEGLVRGARNEPSRIWIAGAAIVLVVLATRSCATVEAGQVAVRINNVTGSTEVVTQPGLILRLPFGIHNVYIMDVTPQTFHLRGAANKSALEGRELDVRAADGSSFAFNDTTLLF